MFGSRLNNNSFLYAVMQDKRTVFRQKDIALLTGQDNSLQLNNKLNYYVRTNKLHCPRKGIYTKENYNIEELACAIYAPSYISLEYVLQKAGVIFQYDSQITIASYLSRTIEIEGTVFHFRKLKGEILTSIAGIEQNGFVNMASPERAFLDLLYLNKAYFFDNIRPLKKKKIVELLEIYQSKSLTTKVKRISNDD
jgi:hypothetical protein